MSLLVHIEDLSKSFGSRQLFQNLTFSVASDDRIGLIGPNGAGKSTLLHIIAGLEKPSEGKVVFKKDLIIGFVPQTCEFDQRSPREILIDSLKDHIMPDYEKETLASMWLSKLGFSGNEPSSNALSGGWKKRLAIGKALILSPDLLLLDEPTNHLDLEGIRWLERFLTKEAPSFVLISHDRYFLEKMVSKVIEISRAYPDGLFAIEGSYTNFLEKKQLFLEGQLERERSVASKARREAEWLSHSPKARTSKSKSRIGEAEELFEDLSELKKRNTKNKTAIDFSSTARETQKLLTLNNIGKNLGGRNLFQHIDLTLSPGSRVALVGANGAGKTTLLRILAGEIAPDQGTIKQADGLNIVYFDQHRSALPDSMTLKEALAPEGDYVTFHGQKIHVNGWCKRFLFSPEILGMTLGKLSGGERARIGIAHLMLKPADILLLDEPTNDLDIQTLETLEESLLDFPGAVVLITHDRFMLERISTSFLSLGGNSSGMIYSSFWEWEEAFLEQGKVIKEEVAKKSCVLKPKGVDRREEKKEFQQIEKKIATIEEKIQKLTQELGSASVAEDPKILETICTEIGVHEAALERLYLRWEELDRIITASEESLHKF